MSNEYKKLIRKPRKRKARPRIIIKNGIRYFITIKTDRKPKFKKPKYIKQKKWIIRDVLLHDTTITDEDEIKKIIKEDKKQQDSYDKCFQMTNDSLYNLLLSNNQYESLTRFIDKFKIKIGQQFSFTRKGKGFSTKIIYNQSIISKEKKTGKK